MEIREANLKDVDVIVEMWKDFMKHHDENIIPRDERLKEFFERKKEAPEMFRKMILKRISDKNALILIAEENDKPVGYCMSIIKDHIPIYKIDKVGYISDLYVEEKFRGKKISSEFKKRSIEFFKRKGMKCATIEVFHKNDSSYNIYKKWGFTEEHVRFILKI